MIKAVSFDFYNTLVRFWPPLEDIQQAACREQGLEVPKEAITRGYAVADIYFNRENENRSLGQRSEEDRLDFFSRYEKIILDEAGFPVDLETARKVWLGTTKIPKDFAPFDDTVPALKALQESGYKLGIITNLRRDMNEIFQRLGLSPYLDFTVSSEEAGIEKPHAPIFMAALKKAEAAPEEVVHVGDQIRSDVMGANDAGMQGVLIDRTGHTSEGAECPTISSLSELPQLLKSLA
ncbi:MAG: HAD family hydrolase [SAR202 cluster bacterium]|nr:HAD family hydrolase [SAR202 cluster bacterium]MQG34347.1 HAD family hydrolase [SAR202 cluster bacterium]HAA96078.1 hypothetical protein [Dehalococcoidia bacterium]HCP24594.1 hypothetical protein [Dehalococcoidia bacterium]|tara:strand:+ start:3770 stop:4477 length:708 start_codon:yes stop_codon:yes gene_type:complete